jgi:hypothetical protein
MDPILLGLFGLGLICASAGGYLILTLRKGKRHTKVKQQKPKPVMNEKDQEGVQALIDIAEKLPSLKKGQS